jgi:peptidoglycan/LPS O-acetylase OafA/YrhL
VCRSIINPGKPQGAADASQRIEELDGLRGLLSLWVVIVHLVPTFGVEWEHSGILAPLFGDYVRVQVFFCN